MFNSFLSRTFFFIFVLFVTGCAGTGKDGADKIRGFLLEKKTKEALLFAQGEKFYAEEKDKLLKLLELGSLHFLNEEYFQALKKFDEAKDLSEKLFTISLSKKVATNLANDNVDNYYGEKYERSLLRYYQALTHLNLYYGGKYESYKVYNYDDSLKKNIESVIAEKTLSEQEKRFHLQAARSVLIEWDSLLSSYKATSGGVATFKEDMLAKLFGALVHELLGSSNDLSIAKGLYKSAKDVLLKYYNMYPVYNLKADSFRSEYKTLNNLKPNELKNFIEETDTQKKILKYIDERLTILNGKNRQNVHFLIEESFVQRKSVNSFSIPLPAGMVPVGIASGDSNFMKFTASLLLTGGSVVVNPTFYFEIPEFKLDTVVKNYKVEITEVNGGKIIHNEPVLVNPISVIGHFNQEENLTEIKTKTGARFLGKQLVAIGSAYALYQSQKQTMGESMAMLAATATYQIANKGIEASERADLRSWATAPRGIFVSSFALKPGSYKVRILDAEVEVQQFSLELTDANNFVIKNIRIF